MSFDHLAAGTPEAIWQADDRISSVQPLDLSIKQLIVVAAHPDDETLGAGGLIRWAYENKSAVTVIVATDGEASHPNSPSHTPARLAALRRQEVLSAVRVLAPTARVHFLGLPDGELRENATALAAALLSAIEQLPQSSGESVIVAPWSGDGHRDHRVTADCASRVAQVRGIPHLGYPIWLWHWGRPDDVPWDAGRMLALTSGQRAAKGRALRAHQSQVQSLSEAPGDEPILSASMHAHFERHTELFFVEASKTDGETLAADWFERFYARHADPWGFETRWYEERKRALLMASLPVRNLGRVLEVGCSTGLITAELSARADEVLALDASATAIDTATSRLAERPNVTLRQSAVPEQWPDGDFDTIIFSEVGYYLSHRDLAKTIALIDATMTGDGCLVACHWRHPVDEYPLNGNEVHAALRSVEGWGVIAIHEEQDFVIEVFARRPVVSVAQREGLQ